MARKRRREREQPSRKEQVMTVREREKARRITLIVGAALGVAAVLVVVALIYQLLIIPSSTVATVESEAISTRDFWNRSQYEQTQTANQLANLINFQQQLDPTGEQGFFTSQIQQLQGELANSEGLANQVLEQMINETVIRQAAAEAGVTVSEDEIDEELASQIAQSLGGVTAPEATATAEALAIATPTPTLTPTPTPTGTVTSTLTLLPTATPEPTPTTVVVTEAEIEEAYQAQLETVQEDSGLSEAQFRQLVAQGLLQDKLMEAIGDQMPTSGERVQASHILISVAEDATEAEEQAALSRAISVTQRLEAGEDFAALAQEVSDDPGSAANGGDLGFFGRGMMVPEFEEAAFSQPIGEVSDPVRSPFGYHIILVTDRDQGEPDFNAWLQDRKAAIAIERRLTDARLPNLPPVNPALLQPPVTS